MFKSCTYSWNVFLSNRCICISLNFCLPARLMFENHLVSFVITFPHFSPFLQKLYGTKHGKGDHWVEQIQIQLDTNEINPQRVDLTKGPTRGNLSKFMKKKTSFFKEEAKKYYNICCSIFGVGRLIFVQTKARVVPGI